MKFKILIAFLATLLITPTYSQVPGTFNPLLNKQNSVIITFQGYAANTADGATQTFLSQPTGSGDRKIVVSTLYDGAAGCTITGVTVAGNSMTSAAGPATSGGSSIFYYDATSSIGSSVTIVVSASASCSNMGIGIWTILNATTGAPYDNGVTNGTGSGTQTVTIDVPANGGAIGSVVARNNSAITFTLTGISEDFDQTIESGSDYMAGGYVVLNTLTTLNINATPSASTTRIHVLGASWGPQ